MTVAAAMISAASTALNVTLYVATGNVVSLGCAIFCGLCFVVNLAFGALS